MRAIPLYDVVLYNPLTEDSTIISETSMTYEEAFQFAETRCEDGQIVEVVDSQTGQVMGIFQ